MLHAFRAIFVVVCAILGLAIALDVYKAPWWAGMAVGGATAFCAVMLEISFARRFVAVISVLMFGLVVGFVVSFFVINALDLIPGLGPAQPPSRAGVDPERWATLERDYNHAVQARLYRNFGITFVFCFLSVLAILHTKDDFKFVIPFVELKREGKFGRPLVLDTSVIIDGRIADVVETRVIDTPIIVPRFVLNELQQVADSSDKLKRNRGRRGLDILNRMRKSKAVDIQVQDITLEHVESVDAKLIRVARMMDGRLVTNDFNLNKVAQVQGVEVININDLANALRPTLLQGERITIKIVKPGEGPAQGVGYLEDGTMVVAEECAGRIGRDVELVVTNVLQTSAGRLVFGRPAASEEPHPAARA